MRQEVVVEMAVDARVRPTYGNWSRPRSAGVFGLGTVGTVLMLVGLIVVVGVVAVGGFLRGGVAFLVLVLVLGSVTIRDRHDRNLIERSITKVGWRSARMKGAHLYRSGPLGFALWGTHQPPGVAAALRLSEHEDSYGRTFGLVHAPMSGTFAVAIETEPDGGALVDDEQVDAWVALWGQWLASLADEPSLVAAAVTIETAPDTGSRLRREIRDTQDPAGPAFAREVMQEVATSAGTGSSSIRGYVTLTFSASSRTGGKRRTAAEMGRDLAARLPSLTAGLASTGAGSASPLSCGEICEVVRTAYDPSVASQIERAHAEGEDTGLTWDESGPAAHTAFWDGYAHDDAYSITWSMSTAPRGWCTPPSSPGCWSLTAISTVSASRCFTGRWMQHVPRASCRPICARPSSERRPRTSRPAVIWSRCVLRRPPRTRKRKGPRWSTSRCS